MYTFSPMMVANSRKHHCRVRSYTREVLVISTNLDKQKNHYPLDFRNRRGDEARIKKKLGNNNANIKSSVDDLVLILRDSEVTLVYDDLECDMPITTHTPPLMMGEVDFDINSPLGEQVVDFLMKNVDVADLPRHMDKQLFGLLLKNSSLTKRMSDEPLGDDLKPRSYDVTFSNPHLDFNDDFTLCIDNPFFDEEFEDISSLNPPKLTLVIDEPILLVTLPSPYLVVLGDEKIDLLLRDDLDILLTREREIDFNPCWDIKELERLLANDHVYVPRVFDEPLGNFDSMSRPTETSDLILEELTAKIGLDDLIPIEIDDRNYDSEGGILFFEHLFNEDTSSDVSPALLPIESSSLDLPLPDPKNEVTTLLRRLKEHTNKKAWSDPSLSSEYERYVHSDFVTCLQTTEFETFDVLAFWKEKETMFPVLSRMAMDILSVQATSVASEFAFSTSRRVLSIRRKRLTLASLEMCMCLKDHLDAQERKHDKSTLETPVDFKEEILDAEIQANESILLSDEEIALDAASSEGSMSEPGFGGEEVEAEANYGYGVYHDDY
ncbi:zinc finger BED domain-containing protein RICESLEEPER 2 [Tanacetum coccineum]|uniref:Zinc finger BED domain-containing protein RICESLEEPER 2 n=1 Tax=Tanacetum coccineum TaxID=301880 RepID=A0ABQ4ZE02_9ASTR